MSEQRYYLESLERGRVGNCVLWWRVNGAGYTCHIEDAETFSEEELPQSTGTKYRAWPVDYILEAATHQVDFQRMNNEFAKA